jgi:hypothetical protein
LLLLLSSCSQEVVPPEPVEKTETTEAPRGALASSECGELSAMVGPREGRVKRIDGRCEAMFECSALEISHADGFDVFSEEGSKVIGWALEQENGLFELTFGIENQPGGYRTKDVHGFRCAQHNDGGA